MDDVAGQIAVNGDEQQQYEDQIQLQFSSDERGIEQYDNLDDSAGNEIQHSVDENSRDSSAGKLFVGGIAWETTEESFSNYFSNYGQIMDSVIMMDKVTGRPRGFGFVTFVDPAVADRVLEEEHIIDGRSVEVKRTVPREDMRVQQQVKGVVRTKKIFVGGIPLSLTEDDLREYFLSYGNVLEQQIMLDHTTGRSRGFGFVTFDTEDAVEKIFSDGQLHELGGKQVEIKRAEPKRPGGDYGSDSRMRRGGSSSRSYGGGGGSGRGGAGYGGAYGGKMGRGYAGQGNNYGGYDDYGGYGSYGGSYSGGGAAGFYASYGAGYGYGFGYGGPMYGAGYGGSGYGTPSSYGAAAGYGGKGYGSGGGGSGSGGGGYGGRGYGSSGYDGGKGYNSSNGGGYDDGGKGYGSGGGGGGSGRYHPYRK